MPHVKAPTILLPCNPFKLNIATDCFCLHAKDLVTCLLQLVISYFFQLEPPPRVTEVSAEPPKTPEKKEENANTAKDTTSQHKSHLFDLHCKICTGT